MNWISVKDKLPPQNYIVFVCGSYPSNICNLATYTKNKWKDRYDNETLENVSHWMELPRFPEEYYRKM